MPVGPSVRRVLLTFHILVSVGWMGALGAYLVLDVNVAMGDDPAALRAAWVAMGLVAKWAILPLAYAATSSGIVLGLATKWGLFRHYWVIVSLVLTLLAVGVLVSESRMIAQASALAADPATSDGTLRSLPSTLLHSVGGLIVLGVVLVLNMYKPRGVTPYGWRKERESRAQTSQKTTP